MGKRSNRRMKRLALSFAWKHEMKVQVVGLGVDPKSAGPQYVYAGDDNGNVVALVKATGALAQQVKVPKAVRCIAPDAAAGMVLAGCNDGNIYDVTVRTPAATTAPRVRRSLAPLMSVDWIEVHGSVLYASDHEGGVTAFDVEGNVLWERRDDAAGEGWMVRANDDAVFHGSSNGMRAYSKDGALLWRLGVEDGLDDVRFGALLGTSMFVTAGWMKKASTWLVAVSASGKLRWKRQLASDGEAFKMTGAEALAAVAGRHGGLRVYVSAGTWLFCYDGAGKTLWEAPLGCGTACNMAVEGKRLFIVTTTGTVAAIDLPRE